MTEEIHTTFNCRACGTTLCHSQRADRQKTRIAIIAERNRKLTAAAELINRASGLVSDCQLNHTFSQIDINNLGLIIDRLAEAQKIAIEERI